jgi:hypothetical protein
LLKGHVVERGGFGPVDMELWRFKRGYQRELLSVQIWVDGWVGIYAWIRFDAWLGIYTWLGIYANLTAFKPGRSCIFRRLQNSNFLQGAIQLRLVR